MKSKSLKFTIMIFFVIALIGTYLGVGFLVAPSVSATQPSIDDPLDGLIDDDDENTVSDDKETGDSGEEIILPTDELKLINYGLDLIKNSVGYKGSFSVNFVGNATLDGTGLKVTLNQYANGTIQKCGDEALEEFFYYYDPANTESFFTSNGWILSEYRGIYTNSSTGEGYVIRTKDSDAQNKTYNLNSDTASLEISTYEDVLAQYKILYSLPLAVEFTKENSTITQNNNTNKKYRIITLKLDSDAIPQEYYEYYHGMIKDLPVADTFSLSFQFVINKTNGQIERIIMDQAFTGYIVLAGVLSANANCTARYQINYSLANQAFDVSKPQDIFPENGEIIGLEEETVQ